MAYSVFACFQRMHPSHLEQYSKLTSQAKKRKAGSSSVIDHSNADEPHEKLPKQQQSITSVMNANMVGQSVVDKLIMNMIVEGILPLRLVEQPAFVELITGLQPNRTIISRPTLTRRIEDSATVVRGKLIDLLKEQSHVATTADCWSSHGKSFLGMTVHWIDSRTCERKSA